MDQKIKADWLAALRSGEYQQGRGMLRSADDEFCCLGVLCDLAVKAKAIGEPEREEGDSRYTYPADGGFREGSVLPAAVADWAGVERNAAEEINSNPAAGERSLAEWNDGREGYDDYLPDGSVRVVPGREPKPFTEIADLIEKYL